MLDYGFATYVSYTPPVESVTVEPIPVLGGQQRQVAVAADPAVSLLLTKGAEGEVRVETHPAADLQAPVEAGQTVGVWRVMHGEEILGEYPLRAVCDVPAVTLRWAYGLLMDALLK